MRRIITLAMLLGVVAMQAQNVAKVTINGKETFYDSWQMAVDAANAAEGSTLTLLDFIDEEEDFATITTSMTLDLAGDTLLSWGYKVLSVEGEGTHLRIVDSSAKGTGCIFLEAYEPDGICVSVAEGASLELQRGSIHAFTDQDYVVRTKALVLAPGANFRMTGGSVFATANTNTTAVQLGKGCVATMDGGKVSAMGKSNTYAFSMQGAQLTINGGEVNADGKSTVNCVYATANKATQVDINNGRFSVRSDMGETVAISASTTTGKCLIHNGLFSHEDGLQRFCAEGRYVRPTSHRSTEYKQGYKLCIGDEPFTGTYYNITSEKMYDTLDQALASAVKGDTISVMVDTKLDHDLTIPKGVVVLLPHNLVNSCCTTLPEGQYIGSISARHVYRTLTLADGVKLRVEGELCVSAKVFCMGGGQIYSSGLPVDNYALIQTGKDSKIDVTGKLCVWGYVAGEGSVEVQNSGRLYENFAITDQRGGDRSSEIEDKVFPLHQYYVQNVEVPVTFQYGSYNILTSALEYVGKCFISNDMDFITPGGIGLFSMQRGSTIQRIYDPQTDRINYLLTGNVNMSNIRFNNAGMVMDTRYYSMPLTSNMSINIQGGTLTMTYDYYLLPGAQITVEKDARMVINPKVMCYIHDKEEWGIYSVYSYVRPLDFTCANGAQNRKVRWGNSANGDTQEAFDLMPNSFIDLRGDLYVRGKLMATLSALDNVTGTGSIIYDEMPKNEQSLVYQEIGLTYDLAEIPIYTYYQDQPNVTILDRLSDDEREMPRKLLRDGRLIIQDGQHTYNMQGARVR